MRTEKELWEVVLSRPDLFVGGLCTWIGNLYTTGDIRGKEYVTLQYALEISLPVREYGLYSWPKFEIQPRIEWIKKRIETL